MKYHRLLVMIALCLTAYFGHGQEVKTYPIWQDIPGELKNIKLSEKQEVGSDGILQRVSQVSKPSLRVFLPDSVFGDPRPAVLICPGGGYSHLAINKEGYKVAKWLNSIGVAAMVLKYRLPSDQLMEDKKIGPLQDAQQAMRWIRSHATQWNIDPQKVGVMGFSAGGHLAASLSTMYAKKTYNSNLNMSARPDFSILIYPVISLEDQYTHKGSQENLLGEKAPESLKKEFSPQLLVNSNTPQTFLVHTSDDKAVPVANSLGYYRALQQADVSGEMHIYDHGGHGFGLGNTKANKEWSTALRQWLTTTGVLKDEKVYLFSYFKANGEDGLHYAYSTDGFQWKALNEDASFLRPQLGKEKLMRDPCIIKGTDGNYHMVWTSGWTDKGIGYASSPDLIHWSKQQYIPVMEHQKNARNCWAPEITYDKQTGLYMIYWATTIKHKFPETQSTLDDGYNHRIYYTTTKDFKTFSATELLYEPGFNVIDASIVPEDGRFIMFLKDETREPAAKNIRIAYSTHLTGPYSSASQPITGDYWAEGPTSLKLDNSWVVYFDKYIDKQYGAVQSSDLENWDDISAQVNFPKGTRHGSIIAVSTQEFLRNFELFITTN